MQRSGLWLAGAVVYAAFFWWYTNTGGALSPAEIDRFTETMRQNGSAPEQIANLRRFMAEDEGNQFLMVNVIDLADTPAALPDVPADATSADLLGRYMAHMYPELFKRACHPAFAGRPCFRLWISPASTRPSTGPTPPWCATAVAAICWKSA